MNSSPRRFLGLTARELTIVIGIGVIGCVLLGVIAFFISRAGSAIGTVINDAAIATREATRIPRTTAPTATLSPTATPVPSSTPTPLPTATPTPQPGLSVSVPLPPSSVFNSAGWEVRVLEVQRGDAAAQAIKAANQFNAPAPEGREYVLVRVRVKSVHTDQASHEIRAGDFRLVGGQRVEYFSASVVVPEPRLNVQIFAGGEVEGWLVFETVKAEDRLILIWDPLSDTDTQRVYVALTEGAALPIDPQLDQITPTDRGRTREQPVSVGEAATTDDWIVSVLDSVRGDAAWSMVKSVNQFNDLPEAGMEYVAIRVRVRYIKSEDETSRIDSGWFKLIGDSNVMHASPSVVDPEPALDATLFPGGEIEGWIVMQAKVDESDLLLVFDPLFDTDHNNRRFLTLPH